ncbi:MAG: LD-carboxypeptidase [Oceanihabitans sediminis]|nr:LD-carboxypeptidase [Oceanihabitans sediminis]
MYIYIMTRKQTFLLVFCVIFFFGLLSVSAQDKSIKKHTTLIQPDYLKAGDTVVIVAPSGILKGRTGEIDQAKRLLKSWGLHVVVGKHVFKQNNHFAGTDEERCEDFQNALDDSTISAIWCARGGYGTVRILDKLDYTKFREKPKWIIGYSDITALHNQVHNEGFESLHALMCVSLTKDLKGLEETVATFKDAIFGKPISYTLAGSKYNRAGKVTAPVVGGNLTLLHTMLGSETSIDTSGKILFIEEIGEYKYHIDRMLQSLKRAGYFNNCAGVMVGDMSKMRRNTTVWGSSTEQLILDVLAEYDFPIVFNVPSGHEEDNRALILGRNVEMNVAKEQATLRFLE